MTGARRALPGAAGNRAEDRAQGFLEARGLRLVERNWRCRFGEIDLIMRDGGTLVFAEVRMRRSQDFGGAAASITSAKRRRLIKAAQQYLAQLAEQPPCRFDAVLVSGERGDRIEWLPDAFGAS